ncbi:histidine phosphatase family protein [Actinotalea sp. BY-33]|uniref:Histidine phosphatase family protein n=1 Tax=Actinotalea soli TaxID=2819234 RepID=A0A939LQH0_9CELL|nr:histidine phosphatase family protein [Actinotalea soli]MBO1750214.1 histidine phosphatase family protein [Actinotalea soli]
MTPSGEGAPRRLVLLRHAKAETAGGTSDELRPLSLVGRRQSQQVGARLLQAGLVPGHVLVSSALRTRQTWELLRGALGEDASPVVEVQDLLYEARTTDVLELVHGVDPEVRTVLVVGHEPTMSATTAVLARTPEVTGAPDAGDLAQVRTGLSTATFAVLEVEDWAGVGRGTATLREVVRPAD